MAIDPALESMLLAHIRNGNRALRQLAILAAVFTALPILIGLLQGGVKTAQIVMTLVFAAIAAALFAGSRRDPTKHRVFTLLRDRPTEAVWAYISTMKQHGSRVTSHVMLGVTDGRRIHINAEIGREQELLEALARALPWATVGYDQETEAAFKANPEGLRRSAVG